MKLDNVLKVISLSKSYGQIRALHDVSFSIETGSTVGLIGPNGSGKTTLTEVISKFQEPDEGDIDFTGKRLNGLSPSAVARLGMRRVFQNPRYSPHLTVRENIELGIPARSWRELLIPSHPVTPALAEFLTDIGLAYNNRTPVANITLFQWRCVELIRGLLGRPKLLVLDEPTAGFSEAERRRFCLLLAAWRIPSVAVLLIEHDFATIRLLCPRAIVMNSGQIIADDSPDSLAASELVRRIYLGSHAA